MPTYVYQCKKCQHQFEVVQKMTDEPLKECPKCKGEIARLLFPPAIVFKGPGFYVNDYPSSKSYTSSSPKTDSASAKTAGSSKS